MDESKALVAICEALTKTVTGDSDFDPTSIRGKNISADLQLDSLDVMTFFLNFEEESGVAITDEEIDEHGLLDVDKLADFVVARA